VARRTAAQARRPNCERVIARLAAGVIRAERSLAEGAAKD
jgi:hypothetical protein